jgi:hypothetical protein
MVHSTEYLSGMIAEVQEIREIAEARFMWLNATQFAWKPALDQWSVSECLEHLIRTNDRYFEKLKLIIPVARKMDEWEQAPFKPGLFGGRFANWMGPDARWKFKVPSVFNPEVQEASPDVLKRFLRSQQLLMLYMEHSKGLDLNLVRVQSPVNRLIRFKLGDCFQIMVNHEKRHLRQTERIMQAADFPKYL